MVYVNLTAYNNTDNDIPLNFNDVGSLTQPLSFDYVQVKRFDIPNSNTPLMNWVNNRYSFTLTYGIYSIDNFVSYISYGSGINSGTNPIWDIEQIIFMMNTTLKLLVSNLDALVFAGTQSHLPSVIAPYIIWDRSLSLFSVAAPYPSYVTDTTITATPIVLGFNSTMLHILSNIPTIYNTNFQLYEFVFHPTNENHPYQTSYIIIEQESNSLSSFLNATGMVITTNLPIESETISSSYNSSNQSQQRILQDYIYNYDTGLIPVKTNNIYNAPTEDYRKISCKHTTIFDIKCDVYYTTRDGTLKQFYLPPYTGASIKLHFTNI